VVLTAYTLLAPKMAQERLVETRLEHQGGKSPKAGILGRFRV